MKRKDIYARYGIKKEQFMEAYNSVEGDKNIIRYINEHFNITLTSKQIRTIREAYCLPSRFSNRNDGTLDRVREMLIERKMSLGELAEKVGREGVKRETLRKMMVRAKDIKKESGVGGKYYIDVSGFELHLLRAIHYRFRKSEDAEQKKPSHVYASLIMELFGDEELLEEERFMKMSGKNKKARRSLLYDMEAIGIVYRRSKGTSHTWFFNHREIERISMEAKDEWEKDTDLEELYRKHFEKEQNIDNA